eukprot:scaffold92471_cov20-Cyclotella_meneghiniana.AAC.1
MLTVHDGGNETQMKRLKVRDEDIAAATRISLDSAAAKASKSGKKLEVVTSSEETKIARVSLEPAEPPTSKSAEVKERNTK